MTIFNNRNLLFSVLFTVSFYVPMASAMIHQEGDNAVRVTFAELDLSHKEGVKVLYQRIKTAARKVCGTNDNRTRLLGTQRAAKECFNNAVDNTINKIGNSNLDALHNS